MTEFRYYTERDHDGSFMVVDLLTGQATCVDGQTCCLLRKSEAEEIVEYLHRSSEEEQRAAGE